MRVGRRLVIRVLELRLVKRVLRLYWVVFWMMLFLFVSVFSV